MMPLDESYDGRGEGGGFTPDELILGQFTDSQFKQEIHQLFNAADLANQLGRGTGDYTLKHQIIDCINALMEECDAQSLQDKDGHILIDAHYLQAPKESDTIASAEGYSQSGGDLVMLTSAVSAKPIVFPADLVKLSFDIPDTNIGFRTAPEPRVALSEAEAKQLRSELVEELKASKLFDRFGDQVLDKIVGTAAWADRVAAQPESIRIR